MQFEFDDFGFLLGETARAVRGRFNQQAQGLGVTPAQWLVLLTLMRNPGVSQAQVADQLKVEPITLSRMVDRLEAAGHVTRVAHPSDRRVKQVALTDGGRRVLERLRLTGAEVVGEASRGLRAEDVDRFIGILQRFRENLLRVSTRPPDWS